MPQEILLIREGKYLRILATQTGFWLAVSASSVCLLEMQNLEGINQDGGVEGRALTPSCESTRITTGCWTIIDRKTLELTKKDTPRPRTEEKPQ